MRYAVDPDIARAATLDPAFYADDVAYAATRERVFARTWQWLGDLAAVAAPGALAPRDLACSSMSCAIWRKVSCGKLKSGEDIAEGEDAKI